MSNKSGDFVVGSSTKQMLLCKNRNTHALFYLKEHMLIVLIVAVDVLGYVVLDIMTNIKYIDNISWFRENNFSNTFAVGHSCHNCMYFVK